MIFLYLITFSLLVFFIITLYNYFTAPEIKVSDSNSTRPELISILIPVRNEEHNIKDCINSILLQDYQNKEIIVLDDFSSDNTFEIASSFKENGVRVIKGKELPSNWIGKNWACYQLTIESTAKYILFIDADVRLKPEALSAAFNEMRNSQVLMLSVFPTQIIKSLGEYLIVPLMNWLLLTFLPLKFVYTSRLKSFVAANGQFMLWQKEAYKKIGGHTKVFDKVVEDMELARECKRNNLKIKTLLGGKLIFCKMYNSFNDASRGFQKNFYPGFDLHPVMFLIVISFLFVVFVSPLLLLDNTLISSLPLSIAILSRSFVSLKSKQNCLLNILLHPFQMILMFSISIISVLKSELHLLEWKERKI